MSLHRFWHRLGCCRSRPALVMAMVALSTLQGVFASDHLDSPTVIADPAADIGDIFAWTSSDGRQLNLAMDIVAHRFSDRLQYVFHVDSGERLGETTASTPIVCRVDPTSRVECWAGTADYVHGDATSAVGLEGRNRRFRVFAGLRDDPFFNNVKGTRAMYEQAVTELKNARAVDGAGCPQFDESTAGSLLYAWRHTDGGPATNFLAGWQSSALVISIDLDVLRAGGDLLAVWAAVHKAPREQRPRTESAVNIPAIPSLGEQIERTARPLIKNALVGGPLTSDAENDRRKEAYNRVGRTGWRQFTPDIQRTLAFYDGLDGNCGSQWLAHARVQPSKRYERLAQLLADDRIWVNSKSRVCTQFLAVELAASGAPFASTGDCGGRTPNYDASNMFRSLLINGWMSGFDDGLHRDDKVHSPTEFPFLAAP